MAKFNCMALSSRAGLRMLVIFKQTSRGTKKENETSGTKGGEALDRQTDICMPTIRTVTQ